MPQHPLWTPCQAVSGAQIHKARRLRTRCSQLLEIACDSSSQFRKSKDCCLTQEESKASAQLRSMTFEVIGSTRPAMLGFAYAPTEIALHGRYPRRRYPPRVARGA